MLTTVQGVSRLFVLTTPACSSAAPFVSVPFSAFLCSINTKIYPYVLEEVSMLSHLPHLFGRHWAEAGVSPVSEVTGEDFSGYHYHLGSQGP